MSKRHIQRREMLRGAAALMAWGYAMPLRVWADEPANIPVPSPASQRDPRNLRKGLIIPTPYEEGYCDQPYTVITHDGSWLCIMTTGRGREGDRGQHIVATISADQGRTWSTPVAIEPADGPEASWAMPLVTRSGRVYVFYTYNGDDLRTWQGKPIRADTVGWYCYKYSDDHGRTWSDRRYRLELPLAAVDRTNTFGGEHQIFWGIGKPIVVGTTVYFAFSRCGKHLIDDSEGWFFRSDNVFTEKDVEKVKWQLLPEGDRGLRNPDYGEVHAEQNLVSLADGSLFCMYRTLTGHPFSAYSRDGARTWTTPLPATYTPGGRLMKTPRACPRIWRCANGKFLFWFHNHSEVSGGGWRGRNPAWLAGGVERDGMIHWSQPEILLYDPDPEVRTSYPDLIEQDGRYWITETQKTVARVHEIDPALLEGLWAQGEDRTVARIGLVLELQGEACAPGEVELPETLDVEASGGMALEVWFRLDRIAGGQILLDSRDEAGRGVALTTTEAGTICLTLNDGNVSAAWDCDQGLLQSGGRHHLVALVDAGPRIIAFVVDGQLCDGSSHRTHGWTRYHGPLGNVRGSGPLRVAPAMHGGIESLRWYGRCLRTSEAIANYRAGR